MHRSFSHNGTPDQGVGAIGAAAAEMASSCQGDHFVFEGIEASDVVDAALFTRKSLTKSSVNRLRAPMARARSPGGLGLTGTSAFDAVSGVPTGCVFGGFRLRGFSSAMFLALRWTLPARIGALRKVKDLKPRF